MLPLLLSQALACGGLFCNSAQPVDQVGERILFALIPGEVEGEGEVEVHVQLSYQGPAEEFSWIVPTPTLPELRTSVDDVFVRLGMSTAPLFQPTIVDLGDCNSGIATRGGGPTVDMAASDSGGGESFTPPAAAVTVVSEEQVGPYDAQILTANDAGVLVQWLADNGYDLPPGGADKIAPYVASGSYYIGLKLQKCRVPPSHPIPLPTHPGQRHHIPDPPPGRGDRDATRADPRPRPYSHPCTAYRSMPFAA